ncbi:TraM recognition domain-containing protein, partial [Candidatus Uhrbacteria bacterium]|nr:TraM recognition domain-containing protein [Candidatus Uhrbacteria bacterium]
IINLSKGRIGEDNSRLLGGLLITKMQLAAMERVDTPERERKDFYLYVDEFQNFAVESFANILSEARKYRLCLMMAHQYIAQLTEEVRDAVFGNVGTIITFRVGSPDAMFMEAEFMPRFTPEDIINLPKYNVYIKLLIDGVTSQPFSAITLPPIAQRTQSEEKVIKISRERYAKPRGEIEAKILTWSGMEDADVDELLQEAADKKKAAKESKKPRFEYKCSRCGTDIVLPVELDRSRPIYCDDCIAIVREERKGGKRSPAKSVLPKPAPNVGRPPKPSEGEVVEKTPDEPSISLGALVKQETKIPETATKPRLPERKERKSYPYTCSECGKTFTTSVKLDPSRPLYCEECLEKIRAKRRAETGEAAPSRSHPSHLPTSPPSPLPPPSPASGPSSEEEKRKRKRKRKKKPEGSPAMPSISHPPSFSSSPPPPPPPPAPPPPPKTGTLHTGQTIRFD